MKSNFKPFPEIETKRLILRQLSHNNEQALFDYRSNKDNFLHVDMPVYSSIDEAKEYVCKMNAGVNENKFIVWAICLQDSNEIVGTVSIWNLNLLTDTAELGYGIFTAFRRIGYMKEALIAVLDYGFNQMELKTIEAYTSCNNEASNEFLRNMEFTYEKSIEDKYSNGSLMNVYKSDKFVDA